MMKLTLNNITMVDHPEHYNKGNIECIDAIASALSPNELSGFIKGNIIKYLWRCNHKGGIEDIEKAKYYLDWYVNFLKEKKS